MKRPHEEERCLEIRIPMKNPLEEEKGSRSSRSFSPSWPDCPYRVITSEDRVKRLRRGRGRYDKSDVAPNRAASALGRLNSWAERGEARNRG